MRVITRIALRRVVAGLLLAAGLATVQAQPLTQLDLNNPVTSTIVTNPDGSFEVIAGGNDTWGNTDSFTFLYEEKTGDFDVVVEVIDVQVDDPGQQDSAKASLHARVSLEPNAADVMINATPEAGANLVETITRWATGQGTDDPPINAFEPSYGDGPWGGTYRPPGGGRLYSPADGISTWLRMQRIQNVVRTYYSQDGQTWQMLADYAFDAAEWPAKLYVGLGTVAHIDPANENVDNRVRATYKNYGPTPALVASVDGTPVDPSAGPGPYPNKSVTAINWKIEMPADGIAPGGGFITYNADNKNELILSVDGEGPVPWSAPGYNQGDLDISLSPRDPVAATQPGNLGPYSNPNRNIAVVDPASPVTQAWIPSTRQGLILPTIRKNTQQWNDDGAGGPTSPFHGFSSVSVDFSSRKGFSMDNGAFSNGEIYVSLFKLGDVDPSLPVASNPRALREANIDVALVWFPFDQGWKAGYIHDATQAPGAFWRKQGSHSAAVAEGTRAIDTVSSRAIFQWEDLGGGTYGGWGRLTLPDVDPTMDGMLFCVSNDDQSDNEGQYITAAPYDDGINKNWLLAIRQDDIYDDPELYSEASRSEFGFVYIPYTAGKLVGGQIKGDDGTILHSAGEFSVTRLAAGRWEVTIPGKTSQDGALILQNCGYDDRFAYDVPDDGVLSYEYTGDNKFIIECRRSEANPSPGGADLTPLSDTDFYVAWVDFQDPLTPTVVEEVTLAVQLEAGMVVVSWPTGVSGYTLESTPVLPADSWSAVPGVENNSVSITPTATPQYYRLSK